MPVILVAPASRSEAWSNGPQIRIESREGASGGALVVPPTPPLPNVRARRVGNRVVIDYSFSSFPMGARRPWTLLTSVKSAGTRYAPLTAWTQIRRRHGRVVQLIGLGPPPFRLLVSVLGRGGGRSRVVSYAISSPNRTQRKRRVAAAYSGKIVFAARGRSGSSTSDLYVISAGGARLRQLTHDDEQEQADPAWSPDGRSIVYTTSSTRSSALIISAADGSTRRVLRRRPGGLVAFADAAWSPSGDSIAFTLRRSDGPQIWTSRLDGRLRPVARSFASDPSWAPRGARLVYAAPGDSSPSGRTVERSALS
jgi:dipeptidyl aminopeptidase/acylaminoacyl peptidase